MKYDDASWHYGGAFPEGVPTEAGATHIAMFVAWCVLNGMAGDIHNEEDDTALVELRARQITPRSWFMSKCDGKFTNEDLNTQGNAFASAYYNTHATSTDPQNYMVQYSSEFRGLDNVYLVPDDWSSYDRVAPHIRRKYERWSGKHSKSGWFRRWF